jgi:hypothetical protein
VSKAKPAHDLRFLRLPVPDGVMAACLPCGYHELLGDGLTIEVITERTKDHQGPPAPPPVQRKTARKAK